MHRSWGLALGFAAALFAVARMTDAAALPPRAAAQALIQRILPAHAVQIDVEMIAPAEGGADLFEVETRDGRLVLRGNTGVSVGSGLSWYLRHVARGQVSWNGDNLALPAVLPPVPRKVRVLSPYRHRVGPNYVTLAYSGAWWDRARWEREIDWMALNGINTPLAITGQEAVWQATLRRFRMNDHEIRRYFAGPAYLAWQWMTNMEQFGGPLPQSWIDSHLELGRFIVDRERELGMTPVLQGFSGNVPLSFLEKFPEAKIRKKQVWCEVTPGTAQLDPGEALFAKLGRAFLEEQRRLFGAGHLYAVDPFHEGEPPVKTPAYLHEIGARSFEVVNDFDPQGVLVMQGWTIREEVVKAIPAERMLVLDLTGEKWRDTQAFWGRPWVAGVVHNFGGRNALGGNLPHLAANAPALLADPAKGGNLVGVGFFCEGSEHNPLVYDLATGLGWQRTAPDLRAWVRDWVHARYGRDLPAAQSAWARLLASVYSQGSPDPQMESPLLSRPALTMAMASPWGSFERDYDVSQVWTAWNELLSASGELGGVDPYRYDVVEVARQGLADLSLPLQREVTAAWISGDRRRFAAAKARFLELGADLDTLLSTRRDYLLGRWLSAARRWGTTAAEADLYERNARLLITVWGPESDKAYIFDYASHQWSGLLRGFYLERWKRFFAFLDTQPASYRDDTIARGTNRPDNDASDFYRQLSHWEYQWCDAHETYATEPSGDEVATARAMYRKWSAVMEEIQPRFDWRRAEPRP